MADQDPHPADAGDPRRGDVVAVGDAGDERLGQAGERRCDGEADRQHRTGGTDAEDDREEQREQEARERDRDVDAGGDQPAGRGAEQQRRGAEQQSDDHGDRGRGERELDREPGRDQDPEEDVAAEVVGARPVLARTGRQDVRGVDGGGLVGPEDGREHREQQHGDRQHGRGQARAGCEHAHPGTSLSPPGSSSGGRAGRAPRRPAVLTSSTPTP